MSFIVIDGVDGSGKATQTKLLCDKLIEQGRAVKTISFPNYDSRSSSLVQMYLGGEFGSNPHDVNPYAASSFFAVDRYASYKTDWEADYKNGTIILGDRYTTANAVHQMSKLSSDKWDDFLDWLFDFEYNKMGIPRPDKVIYLDMDPEITCSLMTKRYSGDEAKKDIHEQDMNYLKKCREAAHYAAQRHGWHVIKCFDSGGPIDIETISEQVLSIVKGA